MIVLSKEQNTLYSLTNHVSYDKLFDFYKSCIVKSASVTKPTSYYEACMDPTWVEIM